jgi:uncharacterized protein YndB with AHSA1/START domain/DNA-binding transcriptional ArsR family regulator
MDDVFRALSDPSRRALLDRLNRRNGQTLRELCGGLAMARQSVSKHLAVLEAANLVTTLRRGREKHHFLNAEPINAIADRWITHYDRQRVTALADLKTALEHTAMTATSTTPTDQATEFVYTTYIATTPERVWQALTDPALVPEWWGRGNRLVIERMELRRGGHWRFVEHSADGVHGFEGRYREVTPPERIVQTFEWDGMPGHVAVETMTLEDLGDGRTRLVTVSLFHTSEERDGMLHSGMEQGLNQSYEALDRVLAKP